VTQPTQLKGSIQFVNRITALVRISWENAQRKILVVTHTIFMSVNELFKYS